MYQELKVCGFSLSRMVFDIEEFRICTDCAKKQSLSSSKLDGRRVLCIFLSSGEWTLRERLCNLIWGAPPSSRPCAPKELRGQTIRAQERFTEVHARTAGFENKTLFICACSRSRKCYGFLLEHSKVILLTSSTRVNKYCFSAGKDVRL